MTEGTASEGHVFHFLNYIRRVLVCNADITLGPTSTYDDFGVNSTHQCRDFDAVLPWVDANRWEMFVEWTLDNRIKQKLPWR
jgi:hypothetical protein